MSDSVKRLIHDQPLIEWVTESFTQLICSKKQIHLGINKLLSLWQNQLIIYKTKTKDQRFAAAALIGNIFNGSVSTDKVTIVSKMEVPQY